MHEKMAFVEWLTSLEKGLSRGTIVNVRQTTCMFFKDFNKFMFGRITFGQQ